MDFWEILRPISTKNPVISSKMPTGEIPGLVLDEYLIDFMNGSSSKKVQKTA